MDNTVLEIIAKSPYKDDLVTYLKQLQDYVADVRNGEYDPKTRLQTVDVIEHQLVQKLVGLSKGVVKYREEENYK